VDNKFKFNLDPSAGILYKYYFGKISMKDISSSWEHAFDNNVIPQNIKGFILDYRQASFNFKIQEHVGIANFYKNHLEVFGGLKIAIITNTPQNVIIPIMVMAKDEGYSSAPFSTEKAALEWILN
jgi:hypothetical protein